MSLHQGVRPRRPVKTGPLWQGKKGEDLFFFFAFTTQVKNKYIP